MYSQAGLTASTKSKLTQSTPYRRVWNAHRYIKATIILRIEYPFLTLPWAYCLSATRDCEIERASKINIWTYNQLVGISQGQSRIPGQPTEYINSRRRVWLGG